MADDHQKNSPEIAHRLKVADGSDANAEARENLENALADERDQMDAKHERALALVQPVQKVTDGNEMAALLSITGQTPVRDVSEAPAPLPLGPLPDDHNDVAADEDDE